MQIEAIFKAVVRCCEQGVSVIPEICHRTGLDYVSCSPFRIPLARIAAAQAYIQYGLPGKEEAEAAV